MARLLQLPLQAADLVLRFGQRALLDQGGLGHAVAGLGILLELLGDEGVGVPVNGGQGLRRLGHAAAGKAAALGRPGDAGDEAGDEVAFFVGHVDDPPRFVAIADVAR